MDKVIFKPKILVRKSKIEKIAKAIGCKDVCVYNALAFRTNSQQAKNIRQTTKERYGGIEVTRYPYLIEE